MPARSLHAHPALRADKPIPSTPASSNGSALNGDSETDQRASESTQRFVLHRNLQQPPFVVREASNTYQLLEDDRNALDAAGGAAVSALGHYDEEHPLLGGFWRRAINAMISQTMKGAYSCSTMYIQDVVKTYAWELIESTDYKMSRVGFYTSGTTAVNASVKFAFQYHREKTNPEPSRIHFIGREQSYHGGDLGTLALGGYKARQIPYQALLKESVFHHVSACNPYRGPRPNEDTKAYVDRLVQELKAKIEELGPKTVCAFILEPVVGAAGGCLVALPGYLKAVKKICKSYDIVLIFDEVMCGMGRTGKLHAWQHDGVVPDIQVVGKGLSAGLIPLSAMLLGHKVSDALFKGSGLFAHGETYQNHPLSCAVGLEVLRCIRQPCILDNVSKMGERLESGLKNGLSGHPHVGDIRGRGAFWNIEFVQDKQTKQSFKKNIAGAVVEFVIALERPYQLSIYSSTGCGDNGIEGDGIILAPPYHIDMALVDTIIKNTVQMINDFRFDLV
ncbi:aminotransferase [Polyplosphaeria fusca]|uniref:Aminotransferase n=1 Tax=Polyplosphaeria fusca TaxID=682080 RepID=A0A9P4RB81_9PLEO|nr:aminotransferase [Polyplosphaeria fusca]